LTLVASKAERSILYSANDLKPLNTSLLKPTLQLSLGPVAAGHQKDAAFPNKWQHSLTIALTQPSSLSVLLITQRNGIERSLIKHNIPTFNLLAVEHCVIRTSYEIPFFKLDGCFKILLCSCDLTCESDALRAVVDAKSTRGPTLFTKRKE